MEINKVDFKTSSMSPHHLRQKTCPFNTPAPPNPTPKQPCLAEWLTVCFPIGIFQVKDLFLLSPLGNYIQPTESPGTK